MDIYFYCSYEHSQKGFCMTKLEGNKLIQAGNIPTAVNEFFRYDKFAVLWRDFADTDIMFFGLRGLSGINTEGRRFDINMAITAGKDEFVALRRVALDCLGNLSRFQKMICSLFFVGGPCSYTLKEDEFNEYIKRCSRYTKINIINKQDKRIVKILPHFLRTENSSKDTELLRFAVYTGSRNDVTEMMGGSWRWRFNYVFVMSYTEYMSLFMNNDMLWELYEENQA